MMVLTIITIYTNVNIFRFIYHFGGLNKTLVIIIKFVPRHKNIIITAIYFVVYDVEWSFRFIYQSQTVSPSAVVTQYLQFSSVGGCSLRILFVSFLFQWGVLYLLDCFKYLYFKLLQNFKISLLAVIIE